MLSLLRSSKLPASVTFEIIAERRRRLHPESQQFRPATRRRTCLRVLPSRHPEWIKATVGRIHHLSQHIIKSLFCYDRANRPSLPGRGAGRTAIGGVVVEPSFQNAAPATSNRRSSDENHRRVGRNAAMCHLAGDKVAISRTSSWTRAMIYVERNSKVIAGGNFGATPNHHAGS